MRYLVTSEFMLVVSEINEPLSYALSSSEIQRGSTRSASTRARASPGAEVEADVEPRRLSEAPGAPRDLLTDASPRPLRSMMVGRLGGRSFAAVGIRSDFGDCRSLSTVRVWGNGEMRREPADGAELVWASHGMHDRRR